MAWARTVIGGAPVDVHVQALRAGQDSRLSFRKLSPTTLRRIAHAARPATAQSSCDRGCRRPKSKYEMGTTPAEPTTVTTVAHTHFGPRTWLAGRRFRSMSAASLRMPSATAVMASSLRVRPLRSLHCLLAAMPSSACTARCRWSHHTLVWHPSLLGDPAQAAVDIPAGIEPATPSLPSMRGGFMPPCTTPYAHTTAQVRAAAKDRGVVRREVACSSGSGKSLAGTMHGPPRISVLCQLDQRHRRHGQVEGELYGPVGGF
jgi:hypothetical protein